MYEVNPIAYNRVLPKENTVYLLKRDLECESGTFFAGTYVMLREKGRYVGHIKYKVYSADEQQRAVFDINTNRLSPEEVTDLVGDIFEEKELCTAEYVVTTMRREHNKKSKRKKIITCVSTAAAIIGLILFMVCLNAPFFKSFAASIGIFVCLFNIIALFAEDLPDFKAVYCQDEIISENLRIAIHGS